MPHKRIYLSDFSASTARPEQKEYIISDNKLPGFALRIQPTGTKSWVLRLTANGKSTRKTLGNTKTLAAEAARARAHQMLAAHAPPESAIVTEGDTPAITLSQLSQDFLASKQHSWKPSTLKAINTYLRSSILPALGDTPINQLKTQQIAEWFHEYSVTSPGGANQALSHLRAMLKFARHSGTLPYSAPDPSKPIRRNKRRARGVLLSTDQLSRLGQWLEAPPIRWLIVADAIHLILLTGCRSGEIQRLKWSEVKSDRLSLHTAKTGKRDVLLTEPAQAIIARRRTGPSSAYVFPNQRDASKPIGALDNYWRTIRTQIPLPEAVRLHDLRHTYASRAIMAGETLSITGKLLGHRRPKTTEIYAHLDAAHLAEAANRVSNIIWEWIDAER